MAVLETELSTFEGKKAELLRGSAGKYALVHGAEVVGIYDTELDAIQVGYDRFKMEPFLVRRIEAVETPMKFASCMLGL